MLQDTLENTWRQVSGQVKRWWDGLTEDDLVTLGLGCTLYVLLRRPGRPRARTTLEQTGWGRHRRIKQPLLP